MCVTMHTQDWITKGKGCNHSARLCTHIRVIVDFHEIKREEKRRNKVVVPRRLAGEHSPKKSI